MNASNTKEEKIKAIKMAFEKSLCEINKRREYRMKNYYDCIDDYSWGGLCDKADDELEDNLRIKRDIMIEQVENDGKIVRNSSFYRLVSNSGDVCDGARGGRYGEYFSIDDKFVGVPKKLCTLTKKGYRLYRVSRMYECTLKDVVHYGVRWRSMKLVNETIVEENAVPEYIGELPYIDYQFDTYFNNQNK